MPGRMPGARRQEAAPAPGRHARGHEGRPALRSWARVGRGLPRAGV